MATTSVSAYRAWLPVLTAIWLGLTVTMLAFGRDAGRKAGPVALAVGAGIAVFAGKFIVASQLMLYAGIAALIIAAGWSAWSRTSAERTSCLQCEPTTQLTEDGSRVGS